MSKHSDVMALAVREALGRFRVVITPPGVSREDGEEVIHNTVAVDADDIGKMFLNGSDVIDTDKLCLLPTLTNAMYAFHMESSSWDIYPAEERVPDHTLITHALYHESAEDWKIVLNSMTVVDGTHKLVKVPGTVTLTLNKATGLLTEKEAHLDREGDLTIMDDTMSEAVGDPRMTESVLWQLTAGALYCIDFLNCRNVVLVDEPRRPRAQARRIQRIGVRMSEIHVLSSGTTRKGTTVRTAPIGATPLHSVRGHKVEYGINGKGLLFGKHSGTFWIPQHARGDSINGAVEHSYTIEAQ